MTIPNIITIARFLAVPGVVYALVHSQYFAAFLLFLAAGISDGIDGIIARHFNQRSELGAWLDPIADKSLLVAVYVTLGVLGVLPDWLVIAVVTRDALIVGAVLLATLMERPMAVAPIFVSKANTAAQIGLAVLVLAREAGMPVAGWLSGAMIVVTAGLTIVSAAAYLVVWLRHMNGDGRA